MAYILKNNLNEEFVVPWLTWRDIIHLAVESGYNPSAHPDDFFGSDACAKTGNKIFDEKCSPINHKDSLLLASVLESCLDDIPDEWCSSDPEVRRNPFGKNQKMVKSPVGGSIPAWFDEYIKGWQSRSTLISRASGNNKLFIIDFIEFCKKSGFSIKWQHRIKGSDGKTYTKFDLSETLEED